eukprot:COSAG06_NODE_57016_length_282_cov_0.704918_1_plen_34_part_10
MHPKRWGVPDRCVKRARGARLADVATTAGFMMCS